MTRAEFAEPVAEEVGVPIITILTALSVLSQSLPAIIELCRDDASVPLGFKVKQLCMNQPVIARWEVMKTMRDVKPRKLRKRVAEAMRLKIIATTPEDIVKMLGETVVPS